MRIRRAHIDDYARLWALRVEMLADAPLAYIETVDGVIERGLDVYRTRIAEWTSRSDRALFVADHDGALAGHLGVLDEGDVVGVIMVYVTPHRRGRGVLDRLLDAAARWAREAGRPTLALTVMEGNARAVRAYERLGFADTGLRMPHPHLASFTELGMARPV